MCTVALHRMFNNVSSLFWPFLRKLDLDIIILPFPLPENEAHLENLETTVHCRLCNVID